MFKAKFPWVVFFVLVLSLLPRVLAAGPQVTSEQLPFLNDVSISVADVDVPEDVIFGKTARIYATVHNDSDKDIKGVVRFYNERLKAFVGGDQPFSAVAHGTDVVFTDMPADTLGENPVAVRVLPESPIGDNPANNKVTSTLIVDRDSDHDNISNRRDPDDDNDSVPDKSDVFPLDPKESQDTDKDGVGNQADPDDDNDQKPDTEDPFPTNHAPVLVILGVSSGGSSYQFRPDTRETPTLDSTPIPSPTNPPPPPSNSSGTPASGKSTPPSSSSSKSPPSPSPVPSPQSSTPASSVKSPNSASKKQKPSRPSRKRPKNKLILGEKIILDASKSYDPDGKIVTVKWDFGDGVAQEGAMVDHRYEEPGEYIITLTLADDQGETREQTWKIQIGQKISPWAIGLFMALLLMSLHLFWKQQHSLKKSLSQKKKWSKITPL